MEQKLLLLFSNNSSAPSLPPGPLPSGNMATFYSQSIAASGGSSPLTYLVTSGSLPPGIELDYLTGLLSGLPRAASSGSTYNFSVTVTDAQRRTASANYSISIASYESQVLAIPDLIYYLPLTDAGGTTTLVNAAPAKPAYRGAATNVTFGSAAGPFGTQKAATFNGTSSVINLLSAGAFASDFTMDEFTLCLWIQVESASVWSDATSRVPVMLFQDGTNLDYMRKNATAGVFDVTTRNNNTTLGGAITNPATTNFTGWTPMLIKVSKSGNSMQFKWAGFIQQNKTGVANHSAGSLAIARLGTDNASTQWWKGNLAHFVVINRFTTDAEDLILSQGSLAPANLLLGDGAWTWYNDPRALRVAGKTIVGAVDHAGSVRILNVDHVSRTLSSWTTLSAALEIDDHDNPGLLIRQSDQNVMAWYTKHNGPTHYQQISTNPLDISSFGVAVQLDSQFGDTIYTYANPVQLDGETSHPVYLFFRADNGDSHYSKSLDGGATWASALIWVGNGGAQQRPYQKITRGKQTNTRIDFLFTNGHPNETVNSIWHGYYQSGNWYKSDGTLIGGIANLPFLVTQFTKVYDGATTNAWTHQIRIGSDGNPVAVYATFPTPASDHRYRYARWTGSAWNDHEICTAGGPLYAAETYYTGGICIDPDDVNTIYCSRNLSGAIFEIWKFVTADGGANWSGTQLTTLGTKTFRPFCLSGDNPRLLYITGSYPDFNNYNTNVVLADA